MPVKKTRNNNTMTEAGYWGMVRSMLRRGFRYWRPIQQARQQAKRCYTGLNKRQKWEYQCAKCKEWWKGSEVEVDHIIPTGSLKSGDDLQGFVERLSSEDGYQVLCKSCHKKKTNEERINGKK